MPLGSRKGSRLGRRKPAKALRVNPATNNPPTTNKTRFRLIATWLLGPHISLDTHVSHGPDPWENGESYRGGNNTLADENRKSRRFTNCADPFSAQLLAQLYLAHLLPQAHNKELK